MDAVSYRSNVPEFNKPPFPNANFHLYQMLIYTPVYFWVLWFVNIVFHLCTNTKLSYYRFILSWYVLELRFNKPDTLLRDRRQNVVTLFISRDVCTLQFISSSFNTTIHTLFCTECAWYIFLCTFYFEPFFVFIFYLCLLFRTYSQIFFVFPFW